MHELPVRRSARFIYLSDAEPHSANRSSPSDEPRNVAWRIVAGNNRPLGRSASRFATLRECAESAIHLQCEVGRATTGILFNGETGQWRWTLALDERLAAVAVHAYGRRIECARALAQFLDACAIAEPTPNEVRLLGSRAMRDYVSAGSALS